MKDRCPEHGWYSQPKTDCPKCNSDGLVALQKLSDQFHGEAAQRSEPPQDESDIPKHDVVETLLYCADEIDKAIEEISK